MLPVMSTGKICLKPRRKCKHSARNTVTHLHRRKRMPNSVISPSFSRVPREDFYGIATWYSKDYDGITMGFQQVMWSFGGSYGDPKNYKVRGYLNSKDTIKALKFYTDLLRFAPPNAPNYYWPETLIAYNTGEVAMAMKLFCLFSCVP